MILSDTPNCGITYNRHYDDHKSFIIQATGACAFAGLSLCALTLDLTTFSSTSYTFIQGTYNFLVALLNSLKLYLQLSKI